MPTTDAKPRFDRTHIPTNENRRPPVFRRDRRSSFPCERGLHPPDGPTPADPTDLVIELEDQPVTEGQWRAIEVDSVLEIGGNDIQLQRPLQVVPSDRGVAVVDFSTRSVKQFDGSGTHVQAYGRAGRGPGEFMNPTDGDIAEGTIWIADGRARRLTRIDGDSAETIPVETGALRVTPPRPDLRLCDDGNAERRGTLLPGSERRRDPPLRADRRQPAPERHRTGR